MLDTGVTKNRMRSVKDCLIHTERNEFVIGRIDRNMVFMPGMRSKPARNFLLARALDMKLLHRSEMLLHKRYSENLPLARCANVNPLTLKEAFTRKALLMELPELGSVPLDGRCTYTSVLKLQPVSGGRLHGQGNQDVQKSSRIIGNLEDR